MNDKRRFGKPVMVFLVAAGLLLISGIEAFAQTELPRPRLVFTGKKDTVSNGIEYTLYRLDVENKADYPKEIFEPSPDLPPCGKNTNASRSWVYIYAQSGRYLYSFCGIKSPDELSKLAFNVPKGTILDYVYIVINDRKANREVKSNMVSTTEP